MGGPITLIIYNPETHEPVKTLHQSIIPWGIMKRTMKLAKSLKITPEMTQEEMIASLSDDAIDDLTGLVADVFAPRVTIEELNQGVELAEMLPVMMQVISKAFGQMGGGADPSKPGA